jgi:hypothetical protein
VNLLNFRRCLFGVLHAKNGPRIPFKHIQHELVKSSPYYDDNMHSNWHHICGIACTLAMLIVNILDGG